MNDRRLPKLRFKGFKDDWEQRKLGKVADKVTEKNSGLQYLETLTNSAEFGIISQRDFFDHDISKTTSLGGYYIVRSEDFVYNPRISVTAPVGPINRNKLGRTGVMSPLYTVFRPHDIDTTYLEHFFKSSCWHSFMNFNGDSGARSDRFSIKDNVFFEMPIPTPDIEEQGQIGECLTHLDHLITLHQRKLEKLKIVKKAMLENCFPKNGEKVLKFRFSGFTGDWEQRKLGEIASSFEYGLNAAAKEFDGKNKYIRITDIYDDSREFDQNNVTSPDIDLLNADSYKLTKGDILFARTGASVGKTYIYKDFDGLVYYAGFLIRAKIKDSYIPEFIFQSTLTKAYEKFIKVTSMRSGQPGVNAQEYSQFELMIPEKPEQDKIGIYFTRLDHLITLHQRKLEKLKIIKKSFLEKMFV